MPVDTHLPRRGLICALVLGSLLAFPAISWGALGDRTLRRGMRGGDVRVLQRSLTVLGLRTAVDGAYGRITQARVRSYERRHHLRPDGVVSRAEGRQIGTFVRRARLLRSLPAGFGRRTLARGASGEDVYYLQELLGRLGRPAGVDGEFGPETERQVRAWEAGVGGRVDGRVTPGQATEMRRRAPKQVEVAPSGRYVFPIRGPHSYGTSVNRFGAARSGHSHGGQDVLAHAGTKLVAVTAGRVYAADRGGGAGNYVVIAGDDRHDYAYYHLQSPAVVRVGQRVSAGTMVGRVGCTGDCTGDHLHFEIWTPHWWNGGHNYDPLPTLRRWDASS